MRKTFTTIAAYDDDRNEREVPPDGDAYNELFSIAQAQIAALTGQRDTLLAAARRAHVVLEGVVTVRNPGDVLEVLAEAIGTEAAAVDPIDALPKPEYMAEVECKIVKAILKAARAGGYKVTLRDEEDVIVSRSDDWAAILAGVAASGENHVALHRDGYQGSIWLIWGNGIDVISDHSTKLNAFMAPLNAYVETLEAA